MNPYQVIIKPVVSEKSTREAEQLKYSFVVNKKANKIDISKAIEVLYGVNVKSVNTRPTPKKTRMVRRGQAITKRQNVKKATVTTDKAIDLHKFVSTTK